jgi:hypothetical protein
MVKRLGIMVASVLSLALGGCTTSDQQTFISAASWALAGMYGTNSYGPPYYGASRSSSTRHGSARCSDVTGPGYRC